MTTPALEAELNRLGLPAPKLEPKPEPPVWRPAYPGEEPPF